jgi:uncharacterized protein YggE
MNAVADDKDAIRVTGMGSSVIPADTVTINVKVQSSNNNTTQAATANDNLLNKTKNALLASGMNGNEILQGHHSRMMTYHKRVCNTVNSTITCKYETSHVVTSQMTVQMKRDGDKINKTIEVAKSNGALATISGYSISDMKTITDEVRKKAMDNAQQNAQDYASAYGFKLGKVTRVSESPNPDIVIGLPEGNYSHFRMPNPFAFSRSRGIGRLFSGEPLQPGTAYVKAFVRVTYEVS